MLNATLSYRILEWGIDGRSPHDKTESCQQLTISHLHKINQRGTCSWYFLQFYMLLPTVISELEPHSKSEAKCKTFHMKNSFFLRMNEN